jgi:predicted glycoside hydrolase/deacetylase ChbG (UPF0249 family)
MIVSYLLRPLACRRIVAGRRSPKFRVISLVLLFALLLTAWRPVVAETWGERLGFPPDAKVVILHANELGMCYETNAAGTALLEAGVVRSASAMVPCPWFADLANWCRSHPDADVGLELTINSEDSNYRWGPVSARNSVPSLVDADGYLWQSPIQTMVNSSTDDVEAELLAQIDRAKALGVHPSHLTTHLGALVTRPDLIGVYLRVARQQWIPAVVVELTPEQVERFQQQGFPLPDDIIQLLSDYPLPKVDDLQFVPPAESYEAKKEAFLKLLSELRPGITQIAFQPAVASDALPRVASNWQQRVWDRQLLADDEVQQMLSSGGFVVTDWRELMRRFEGRPAEIEHQANSSVQATP